MDKFKRIRAPVRASITRTLLALQNELQQENPDYGYVEDGTLKLKELKVQVCNLDSKIMEALVDSGAADEDLNTESQQAEQYTDRIRIILRQLDAARQNLQKQEAAHKINDQVIAIDKRKTYKLPKIEIKKFNGELIEWLGFWSQFSKIHDDPDLADSDKFQYLSQSMCEGTRAYDLVHSYPQNDANYNKVITALKERFGREKLLKQVYVRELLKMVISNAKDKRKVELTKMFDKLESHLRALESLGITSDQTAEFLYPMVESALPEEILVAWQRSTNYGRDGSQEVVPLNEMDYLLRFLRGEVEGEEQRQLARIGFTESLTEKGKKPKQNEKRTSGTPTAFGLAAGQIANCLFCDKMHASHECIKAQKLSLSERKEKVKEKNCCYACLKPNHSVKNCRSILRCILCGRKHHILMCNELQAKDEIKGSKANEDLKENVQSTLTANRMESPNNILLMTCLIRVRGEQGKTYVCRVLFDSGSSLTRIKTNITKLLGLQAIENRYLKTAVFGGGVIAASHSLYDLELESIDGTVKRRIQAYDEDKLCGALLPKVSNGPWIEEFRRKGIRFNELESDTNDVDLIIGSQYLQKLLTGKRVVSKYGYIAVQTVFGWTLTGTSNEISNNKQNMALTLTSMVIDEADITQLWKLDNIGILDPIETKSKIEKDNEVVTRLIKSLKRKPDGRYVIRLPWKEDEITPPDNRTMVEGRLRRVTSRLKIAEQLNLYDEIFTDWVNEGFIEETRLRKGERIHYLPHHPVFKPGSITTPVRPVFDASCRMNKLPSLNDCLEKGPNFIELIPPILTRFRMGNFGITSDIRKAFQMIEVDERDRDVLSFLWWEYPAQEKQIKVFRHKRVVFGVNCSPFILGAVLDYHCSNVPDDDRFYAEKLKKSLYVDNCITSVNTMEEYFNFKDQATRILADCKMQLRQWECSYLVDDVNTRDVENNLREVSNVLGLLWNKRKDTLNCNIPKASLPTVLTKRVILSVVQRIFDPLGFLCPITLFPKLLLQQTWLQKLSWDEELNCGDTLEFKEWYQSLSLLDEIEIPRSLVYFKEEDSNRQLHIFCDASKKAYAVAVFLRVQLKTETSVILVQGKCRVAPLKKATMPRLELLACTIAARLGHEIKDVMGRDELICYYWTDSSIALAWIQREDLWGAFVSNRVREINALTDKSNWRHIPGAENPADLPSRGCTLSQFKNSEWWYGPPWLKSSPEYWPVSKEITDEILVQSERKKTVTLNLLTTTSEIPWYAKTSSYAKNVRIMIYVLRFIKTIKERRHILDEVTVQEFNQAEEVIFRLVQQDNFFEKGDIIAGMRIQRDSNGLIRVATRLTLSDDERDFRYPILLPHMHVITTQLIRHKHFLNYHAGIQFLMGEIREKCWIIQGRKAIRRVINNCVICKRYNSRKPTVPLPPLPRDRVHRTAPFDVTGIDLAGPLHVKQENKAWIVIFTCAVYRCVHLELTDSLSTEAFLLAFYRFVSRRRRPTVIYTDNGTNFTGAAKLFADLNWKKIVRDTQLKSIQWKFNPPSAAWWRGWWERLIGMVKSLLQRMLGHSKLNYVQMETYLCEVEALLNNRPLTYVSEDQQDLIPLTPARFLGEAAETTICPEDEVLKASRFRQRYKELTKLREELKTRFKKEYLGLLVQKGSKKGHRTFNVGEVVLIGSDNTKRITWPLAVILELIPGKDGNVRVAKLKTGKGTLVRPLQRLYPLEITDESELTHDVRIPNNEIDQCESPNIEENTKYFTRSGREVKKPKRY